MERAITDPRPSRPRIGIDLHVVDGIYQGSRAHCLELFSRVIGTTPECDFVLLANDARALTSFHSSFALPNVTIVPMHHRPAAIRLLAQIPGLVKRMGIGLLHTQYITPPLPLCPTAVTVHDILFESHPEFFDKLFVLRSRLLVPFSIRHSAVVFTVSKFSLEQICSTYAISPSRVHVIPNGVDSSRFYPGDGGLEIVRAMGLDRESYFLTVGRIEPRKNHVALLQAWSRLPKPRPILAIVGQHHFQYEDVIRMISELSLEADVRVFDKVSDVQLPAVYRNARGFIYASWAEGFGMPLLEAMASGVPVITSATTALSEVGADAASYVNPADSDSITNAVRALMGESAMVSVLVHRGLARVKEYTWEKSAQVVREAYVRQFGRSVTGRPARV